MTSAGPCVFSETENANQKYLSSHFVHPLTSLRRWLGLEEITDLYRMRAAVEDPGLDTGFLTPCVMFITLHRLLFNVFKTSIRTKHNTAYRGEVGKLAKSGPGPHSVKEFYWNTATLICLCVVWGCYDGRVGRYNRGWPEKPGDGSLRKKFANLCYRRK